MYVYGTLGVMAMDVSEAPFDHLESSKCKGVREGGEK